MSDSDDGTADEHGGDDADWGDAGPSQKEINESMLREGDVEVQYAPVLPFLTVPDRKAALRQPFKLPAGAVVDPTVPRKSLGARRRRPGDGIRLGFKLPTPTNSVSALVPIDVEEAEEEEPEPVAAPAAAAAGEVACEPLVLWSSPDGTEPAVQVAVEPFLCKFLREHQREGVQFMFDCVNGLKPYGGNGCILADDMGLGKTLQSITLMMTLVRQGITGKPTARRVIVVCPTSLVANWAKEINKWVGDRMKVVALAEASRDQAIMDINTFTTTRTYPVLIISYETFRIHAARFHGKDDACDLLICDEAHRLKNDKTLTTQALAGLACRRRILLSGTPMQNDLDEFWAMVDFTNPGVLGDAPAFRKRFSGPILESREPWASERVKTRGDEASKELSAIVNQFILRRTNALLSAHLPPKLMQVVCVRMSPLQQQLYDHFLSSKELSLIMSGTQKGALSSITALRKLVNHPRLIYDVMRAQAKDGSRRRDDGAAGFEDCEHFFPDSFHRERSSCVEMSGKFELTARMLHILRTRTDNRIVIVSCYTQTLDIFTSLCRERHWPCIRLDGSTAPGKRQKLVDKFNDPKNDEFVFLLSSKAGGCGLNLIGGNRLILFDPDWNPATDLQAAARVWRDGQRKKVYVYRFLATGTLEEKVFQRQLSKKGLQTLVVEEGDEVNALSSEDLRNLFSKEVDTPSDTHDMLRCMRCRKPELAAGESDAEVEAEEAEEAAAAAVSNEGGVYEPDNNEPEGDDDHVVACGAGASSASAPASKRAKKSHTNSSPAVPSDTPRRAVAGDTTAITANITAQATTTPGTVATMASDNCMPAAAGMASSNRRRSTSSPGVLPVAVADDDNDGHDCAGVRGVTVPAEDSECEVEVVSDVDPDDDDDIVPVRKRKAGGKGGRKASATATATSGAGTKRKRVESKAAQRKAAKEAELQRKAYEDAIACAIKESLAKALPPVEPGTVRRQLKWPGDDDLKRWSHHMGVEAVADDVLAEAAGDLVTFTFGCEVQGKDLAEFAPVASVRPPSHLAPGRRSGALHHHTTSASASASAVLSSVTPAASGGSLVALKPRDGGLSTLQHASGSGIGTSPYTPSASASVPGKRRPFTAVRRMLHTPVGGSATVGKSDVTSRYKYPADSLQRLSVPPSSSSHNKSAGLSLSAIEVASTGDHSDGDEDGAAEF